MCHGYGMKWWKSETTATKDVSKPARQDEKPKTVSEKKVEDKELIPGIDRSLRRGEAPCAWFVEGLSDWWPSKLTGRWDA
jgi:hypothetical protein